VSLFRDNILNVLLNFKRNRNIPTWGCGAEPRFSKKTFRIFAPFQL